MSETQNTTPAGPTKPQVNLPAGWVAFVKVSENRALGISHFKYPSIAFTDTLIVSHATVEGLLAELTRLGYSYPTPTPPRR
jgi:hypothetical protein